jgi:hypothetical protein
LFYVTISVDLTVKIFFIKKHLGEHKMKHFKRNVLLGFALVNTLTLSAHATDMLGNPTLIGVPGQLEILAGGGQSTNFVLEQKKSTGTLQIGTLSEVKAIPVGTSELQNDHVFIGLSYALNARAQLFTSLSSGKKSSEQSTTSSRAIGVKISPYKDLSSIRMGLLLRAQQVTTNIDGEFSLPSPYNAINDGTDNHSIYAPLSGSEQIKYTRLDAFLGASASTGIFRPYGGFCLSSLSGTDTLSMNDSATVYSIPVGGGASTTSTQNVSFDAKADISASKNFSAVLGFSINPDSDLSMTVEFQTGVQNTVALSGGFKF